MLVVVEQYDRSEQNKFGSERNVVWRRCLVAVDTQMLLNEQIAEQKYNNFHRDGEQYLSWSCGHEQNTECFLAFDVFKIMAYML